MLMVLFPQVLVLLRVPSNMPVFTLDSGLVGLD